MAAIWSRPQCAQNRHHPTDIMMQVTSLITMHTITPPLNLHGSSIAIQKIIIMQWWKTTREIIIKKSTTTHFGRFFFLQKWDSVMNCKHSFRHWNVRRWNGRGVKRTRALGQYETYLGVKCNGAILPHSILPHSVICPNVPCSILPPGLRLEKSHHVNYKIARLSIKMMWKCEKEAHNYIQPHRTVLLVNLSTRVNWIIKRVQFRFCEILKTWSITSLISMYDAELANDRNQVDVKIDPVFHFAPMFHFAPTSLIYTTKRFSYKMMI